MAVTATVINSGEETTDELILELVLPAGFQALSDDLGLMDAAGQILDYLITPGGVTVRLEPLAARSEASLTIHIVTDFTGQVFIPTSRVYELSTPGQTVLAGSDGAIVVE